MGNGDLGGIVDVVGIACAEFGLDLVVTPGNGLDGKDGVSCLGGRPGDLQLLTTAVLTRLASKFCPKLGISDKADKGIEVGLF